MKTQMQTPKGPVLSLSKEPALSARFAQDAAQSQPKGVVITIDPNGSNLYWSTLIGRPFTLANLLALQAACRDFARLLDGEVRAMIERAAEARVRGDVGFARGKSESAEK